MTRFPTLAALALATQLSAVVPAVAQPSLTVQDPWVRGTVAQQQATGLFARLTSTAGGRLVAARSPVAGTVEIHEMRMDGDIMRMRAVPALDLPAGQVVELKPGGYHVMLMGLRQPMKAGDVVPVTLVVEGRDGKREDIEVKAEVRALGAGPAGKGHDGKGHGSHGGHRH